jgi:hypothetical protein
MTAPREILALDLATRFGWAGTLGGTLRTGNHTLAGKCHGSKFGNFRLQLAVCLSYFQPHAIYYEDASHAARRVSTAQSQIWFGLRAHMLEIASARGIECIPIGTGEYKQGLGLKGNAPKDEVRAAVEARGIPVACYDEADAVAILAVALRLHGTDLGAFKWKSGRAGD